MTRRARAERVVEREQPRLRNLVRDAARAALEPLAEAVRVRGTPVARRPRPRRRRRRLRGTPSRSNRPGATRTSALTRRRSTMTATEVWPRSASGAATASSSVIARPPTSTRPNPRLRSVSRVAVTGSSASRGPVRAAAAVAAAAVIALARRASSSASSSPPLATAARDDGVVEADEQARAFGERRMSCRRRRPATRARPRVRTAGRRCGRRAPTAAAGSHEFRWSCRPSSADCGCCSSAGWRSPARCPRCRRRPASPSARGTGGRRPKATRRSGAGLRRRWCRRRARICPSR